MAERKFPEKYQKAFYVDGFLDDRVLSKREPDYGYRENHLPNIKTVAKETESLFEIAVRATVVSE